MKIVRKLEAPASFIFDTLVNSSIHDIQQQTKKKLTKKQLKGFEYNKVFSKNRAATITIVDVVDNELYSFKTATVVNEFTTSYQLRPLTDTSCEVICEEKQVSHGFFQKLNDMLVGTVLGWLKKRQIRFMLDAMAKEYK